MTQQTGKLMGILNPVHHLTVEDWMRIAEILHDENAQVAGYKHSWRHPDHYFQFLMQRWEELTRGKLVNADGNFTNIDCETEAKKVWQPALLSKSMFVCEPVIKVEQGIEGFEAGNYYEKSAQLEVLFAGFKFKTSAKHMLTCGYLDIAFYSGDSFSTLFLVGGSQMHICTIADLIFEIDRYNRTATAKIVINFTENILTKLLK